MEDAEQALPKAGSRAGSIIRGGLQWTRTEWLPRQVSLGSIKAKEINQRPARSLKAGMLLADGR